jgi:superfamily II DNA helicase RecQ
MDRFIHLPEFRVIICKECKYAVLPNHIDTHFTGKPHNLGIKERRRIANEVAEIDGLIGNEEALRRWHFPFPPPTSSPVEGLAKPKTGGFQCRLGVTGKECKYICFTVDGTRRHCVEKHQWKSTNKGGRGKKHAAHPDINTPWRTGVKCQRFFVQGPKSGYFEVQATDPDQIPSRVQIRSRIDQFKEAKREMEAAFRAAEAKERREIKEFDEARESNPWLRRVKWQAHTAGLDAEKLRELVSPVGDNEPELQVLYRAFDWMIQGAQYTTVQEVVGQAALFEVNKKEAKQETQMPFDSWMDITTVRSYTQVWRQILGYIFRAEDTDPDDRPAYQLTSNQAMNIQSLRDEIRKFREWKHEMDNGKEDQEKASRDEGTREENDKYESDEYESDEEIERIRVIQREVLRLCISLLNHPLQDNEYKSAIISGLAILGMKDDGGWLNAEDYTPKYSAVIKLARLMVVQEAYERKKEAMRRLQEDDNEITDAIAREQTVSYYHLIGKMVKRFMTMANGKRDPTPMQWIFQARSYGLKIRYTTTAEGCIQWIGDTILYQQIRFSMAEVRTMVHGLVREARELLFRDLMLVDMDSQGQVESTQVPGIDWDNMVDNPTENRVGWSFLDDERNRFEVDGKWWLYKRMFTEQRVRQRFTIEPSEGGRPVIRKEIAAQYQRHVEQFLVLLLLLFHLCGGQPGRAPEILGLRWKNSRQGGVRNIIVENAMVAFVTGYHKGYRNSGNVKIIHRYLPREVGELFVYFVWLIWPFNEDLQLESSGKRCNSPFLWGDSKKVEHRRWTGPKKHREAGDDIAKGEDHNRGWTSERMRRALQEASMRLIGVKIHISCWRNSAIAMSRRYCREAPFPSDDPEADEAKGVEPDDDNEHDLQAGHGTHIAGMIYARELMEDRDAVVGRRGKFRKVSEGWHKFLNFTSSHEMPRPETKRKRQTIGDDMQDAQIARWKRLRTVDIQSELQSIIGEGAAFRGKQEEALRAIMANVSPVLVVMGTGAGKSLLFQLPAHSQKSGTTVVVVPLKTLERDLHERCCKAGISSITWDANQPDRMAQIVFVQPESAVGTKFGQYLNRLEGLGQLDRFVLDECHTVRQSRPDFRPKMREAGAVLKERGKQMIFLTATLSPASEGEFFEIMRMPPVQAIRGPTTRPNIKYSVFEHEEGIDQIDAVGQMVRRKLQEYPAPAKIIIYSSSIETIKEMGERLGYPTYYADVGSERQKAHIQQQWENATQRVIICSNAFGLGIDQPDVRFVGHVGPIHDIENYGQESGRAGRGGQPCEAVIFAGPGRQQALQQQHERQRREPTKNQAIITDEDRARVKRLKAEQFISGISCRRVWLDQELDGRTNRTSCEGGEQVCDVCAEEDQMVADAEALQQAYIVSKENDAQRQQDRMWDSGIEIPSSVAALQMPSSPPGDPFMSSSPAPVSIASSPVSGHPPIALSSAPGHPPIPVSVASQIPGQHAIVGSQEVESHSNMSADNSPCRPPSSIESFDQGFATDITPVDRIVFRRQQEQRQAGRAYTRAQNIASSRDIHDLERQLEWWVGRCPLCVILGCDEQQTQHTLSTCSHQEANGARKAWFEMGKSMRPPGPGKAGKFAPFSCCYGCFVPQAMCQKWQRQEGQGRTWKLTSRACQFSDIIMPVVVCMFREGSSEAGQLYHQWIAESGVSENSEGDILRWFGQKVIWGGVEGSKLCQVFWEFSNIIRREKGVQDKVQREGIS